MYSLITMKIVFSKINPSHHEVVVYKNNLEFDMATLHTQTYFLHDITHFCVELELGIQNGFWGMIAQGYKMNDLASKENELGAELRGVEKIVGPVQALYNGHMSKQMFEEHMSHINFKMTEPGFPENVVGRIHDIMNEWKYMESGKVLVLNFAGESVK